LKERAADFNALRPTGVSIRMSMKITRSNAPNEQRSSAPPEWATC
jgi:hypothetical protein